MKKTGNEKFCNFHFLPSIIAILKQQGYYEGGVASSKCCKTDKRRYLFGVSCSWKCTSTYVFLKTILRGIGLKSMDWIQSCGRQEIYSFPNFVIIHASVCRFVIFLRVLNC